MGIKLNLIGNTYNHLTVVSEYGTISGKVLYQCKCSCGNIKVVVGYDIKTSKSKSCGCLRDKLASKKSFKHGLSKSKEYIVWAGMIARCNNKNHLNYKKLWREWHYRSI